MNHCPACGGTTFINSKYDDHLPLSVSARLLQRARIIFFDPRRLVRSLVRRIKSGARPLTEKIGVTGEAYVLWGGEVAICTQCGHGALESMPSDSMVERYYDNDYWDDDNPKTSLAPVAEENDYHDNPRASQQLHLVLPVLVESKNLEILEIGAGPAFASQLLRSKLDDCQIYVCEAGRIWDSYYQARSIERIASFFPFVTSLKFDYLHTSHWLEHVIDVRKTVSQLRDMTKKGGHVFVEVPNTAHDYWSTETQDNPHLHFFTPNSIQEIFTPLGFKTVMVDEFGPTLSEAKAGIAHAPDQYTPQPGGLWIRALFEAS